MKENKCFIKLIQYTQTKQKQVLRKDEYRDKFYGNFVLH